MIEAQLSSLKQNKPHEYLVRFAFGGSATVLAALIAEHFGPGPGGLFLAFPAIFPATATLIETHTRERKAAIGHDGTIRGRMAASLDAAGATLGCVGLAGFALVLWRMLPHYSPWLTLLAACTVWLVISVSLWKLFKRRALAHPSRALKQQRKNP